MSVHTSGFHLLKSEFRRLKVLSQTQLRFYDVALTPAAPVLLLLLLIKQIIIKILINVIILILLLYIISSSICEVVKMDVKQHVTRPGSVLV